MLEYQVIDKLKVCLDYIYLENSIDCELIDMLIWFLFNYNNLIMVWLEFNSEGIVYFIQYQDIDNFSVDIMCGEGIGINLGCGFLVMKNINQLLGLNLEYVVNDNLLLELDYYIVGVKYVFNSLYGSWGLLVMIFVNCICIIVDFL